MVTQTQILDPQPTNGLIVGLQLENTLNIPAAKDDDNDEDYK